MPHFHEALERIKAGSATKTFQGRKFERLIKAALRAHPGEYGKARFRNLWLWREWPDCPGQDIGIDIVGEQTEAFGGGLCAIQCKFYDSTTVSTRGVESFLAAAVGPRWAARIFVATTDYSSTAQKRLSDAGAEVITGHDLDAWPVGDWRDHIDDPTTIAFTARRYEPRPDQHEALAAIRSRLFDGPADRGRLVMPCGTGKSVVALWAAEQNVGLGGRVLYLVPSIALMGQTMREWAAQRGQGMEHRYIGVCSDARAGRSSEDADLTELAMPVTTDVAKIASELKRESPETLNTVFCTYHSLPRIAEAQRLGVPAFDLVICDEAHRTTGVELPGNEDERSGFTLVHDEYEILADKRLYMTATQRIYADTAKSKASEAEAEIYSMDDETIYGPRLYDMSFGAAIDQGLLTDYEVVVIGVDEQAGIEHLSGYWKQWIQRSTNEDPPPPPGAGADGTSEKAKAKRKAKTKTLDTQSWLQLLGCWDALADPLTVGVERNRPTGVRHREHACLRAIAFTNTIKASKLVQEHWRGIVDWTRAERREQYRGHETLALDVVHIDGTMNAYERSKHLGWLRQAGDEGGARVLTNARCLTEGVDVPALDAVLFMAPKRSDIDVVQAVGRVMRRAEGKDVGYIVLPVLVPSGLTMVSDEVLRGSDFAQVWQVLRALRSHDERLRTYVNSVKLARKLPVRIIDTTGSRSADDDRDAIESVQLRMDLLPEVASVIVERVGDRQYWPRWGKQVADVTRRIQGRVTELVRTDRRAELLFRRFQLAMADTLRAEVADQDLTQMLAQHIVTQPVFDVLFGGRDFSTRNPIARAMKAMMAELVGSDDSHGLGNELDYLHHFYEVMRRQLSDIEDSDARLEILDHLYESFFKHAMPEATGRLGIAYTPTEIVDFILRSADGVCRREFGVGLTDPEVHVLDPFAGTGTFLNRLLTIRTDPDDGASDYLVTDADLARKFGAGPVGQGGVPVTQPAYEEDHLTQPEMHANEVVLLAYYIASLKIEEAYQQRTGAAEPYRPFRGIALVDTFNESTSTQQRLPDPGLEVNSQRVAKRKNLPLRVIVGNPPWSAGQKSASDNAANTRYDEIAQRIRETYGARGAGGKALGNIYVQAIRWASDRLDGTRGGIVAFVHPNSLTDGVSLAGMRAVLREEFTSVYVLNLRGDAYKQGAQFELEGDKIFGSASRNGVQLTVLVRNPNPVAGHSGAPYETTEDAATLRYAETPDRAKRQDKFRWLKDMGDVTSPQLTVVPETDNHDWRNLTDGTFGGLLPVYTTAKAPENAAFDAHALGVTTSCDPYVYSFTRSDLIDRVQTLINEYEYARRRVAYGIPVEAVMADTNLSDIKWTGPLKQSLKKNSPITFDESRIRQCLYRPFVKLWLYEDDRILSSVKTIAAMFPRHDATGKGGGGGSTRHLQLQQGGLRNPGHHDTSRPLRGRNRPSQQIRTSNMEAILMMRDQQLTYGVLASRTIHDLHVTGRPTRCLPRSTAQ